MVTSLGSLSYSLEPKRYRIGKLSCEIIRNPLKVEDDYLLRCRPFFFFSRVESTFTFKDLDCLRHLQGVDDNDFNDTILTILLIFINY